MVNKSEADVLSTYIETIVSRINVMLPAEVTKYDFKKQKVSVKPLINYVFRDGESLELPIINNVPLMFPASGGASITMPVKIGDIVEIRFCQRSLEEWLSSGEQVTPDDSRTHDLTDAIATPGLMPFSSTSPASNNDDLEVKYKGATIVIDKDGKIIINSSTEVKVPAPKAIIDSADIKLGDGAILGVARIGDAVQVDSGTHIGTIIAGSLITKSL